MRNLVLMAAIAAISAGSAVAHHELGGQHSKQAPPPPPAIGQKAAKGTGVIQQIDREKGVVTAKHGPLYGISMSGMTMSFLVSDKAMLANLQPLQKVEFELTYDGKQYLITSIK